MLPTTSAGSGLPTLVMMSFLGGTQAEWSEVVALLGTTNRCLTIDLPGFGAAAAVTGYKVSEMADRVIDSLKELDLFRTNTRYVLVGHSMAGKVSAVVTRRLLDDDDAVRAPAALVLISPSPPSPEPMEESKRSEMLAMFGPEVHKKDLAAAKKYISDNVAISLSEEKMQRSAEGVLAMNRDAWAAWLEHGSKEDWSEFVGTIDLPTLIVAGKADAALGPKAQREKTLPHFPVGQLIELECSHLAPLESSDELASLITNFILALNR